MRAGSVVIGRRATTRDACARARSAGHRLLDRRRRPAPPRPPAVLVRLLLLAGLCVAGSALLGLLGDVSASATPTVASHARSHADRAPGGPAAQTRGSDGHATGLVDGVGRLASSALGRGAAREHGPDQAPASGHRSRRGDAVINGLVDSVLTGKARDAEPPKVPASHRPRDGRHGRADDGIGRSAGTRLTAADRAVASVARSVHPVTTIVTEVAAPVRSAAAALTAPLVPILGDVVTPLRPVAAPAGHLVTSTGLVPVPGGFGHPPGTGAGSHHRNAAGGVAFVRAGHRFAGFLQTVRVVLGGSGATAASQRTTAGHREAPVEQPTPFWPLGSAPMAGGGSSDTMNAGPGGNAVAGHAERVGATPWPDVVGIARSSDHVVRQLEAAKPPVSPD